MTDATPHQRRNRTMLLLIAALFFGGMLLAGALRFSGWRPAGMKNHGELLQTPADLRAMHPRLADGSQYAWQPEARRWRIIVAPPIDCAKACDKLARDIDLVWQLMGKNAAQMQVLWLCPTAGCAPPQPLRDSPALQLLRPDAELRAALPAVDGRAEEQEASVDDAPVPLYVIDPNGFVILRYPPGSDPGGLRADLAKLLKLM